MSKSLSYSARSLHRALSILYPYPRNMGTATVYTDRPLRRNLSVYRELESAGLLTIGFARDVTTPNMRHRITYITFTLKGN